jgi:hypothetical protein
VERESGYDLGPGFDLGVKPRADCIDLGLAPSVISRRPKPRHDRAREMAGAIVGRPVPVEIDASRVGSTISPLPGQHVMLDSLETIDIDQRKAQHSSISGGIDDEALEERRCHLDTDPLHGMDSSDDDRELLGTSDADLEGHDRRASYARAHLSESGTSLAQDVPGLGEISVATIQVESGAPAISRHGFHDM